jgi:hypothetical protein
METTVSKNKCGRMNDICGIRIACLGKKSKRNIVAKNTIHARMRIRLNVCSSCLGFSQSNHLGKIRKKVIEDTSPPESYHQNNKPNPLQPGARIVDSDPIPPHAKPQKEHPERTHNSQNAPRKSMPKSHLGCVDALKYGRHGEHKQGGKKKEHRNPARDQPIVSKPGTR